MVVTSNYSNSWYAHN